MANEKNQTTKHNLSDFESDSQDTHYQSSMNLANKLDGARVALTLLALLVGITILGLSADALAVYNSTQLPGGDSSFLLSLWPADLNLRPTVALVAGSAVVTAINIVSLLVSKVKVLRHRVMIHTPMTFIAPLFGFIAAMVAMAYFYAVNASDIEDTMQSWSCRWTAVQMTQKPHFATLCRQSKAGLYLAIILIPIEGIVFAVAAVQAGLERKASSGGRRSKTASPVLN